MGLKRKDRYGPYHDYVARQKCVLWTRRECFGRVTGHHVRSVGAGGRDHGNEVPLCLKHHHELHTVGRRTFEREYGLDLKSIAQQISRYWGGV